MRLLTFVTLLLFFQTSVKAQDTLNKKSEGTDSGVILPISRQAEFKGGLEALYQYVAKHVKYPYRCMENGIEGVVIVSFIVEKDGQVSNVKTLTQHKSCPEMDTEAIRVIKKTSGKWMPGLQRNKAVRCSFRLPVRFDLG